MFETINQDTTIDFCWIRSHPERTRPDNKYWTEHELMNAAAYRLAISVYSTKMKTPIRNMEIESVSSRLSFEIDNRSLNNSIRRTMIGKRVLLISNKWSEQTFSLIDSNFLNNLRKPKKSSDRIQIFKSNIGYLDDRM